MRPKGPLSGLRLIGFSIWERRGGGRNVVFPARTYSVNGERRSFALLRPVADASGQDRVRDLILSAYAEHEQAAEAPVMSGEYVERWAHGTLRGTPPSAGSQGSAGPAAPLAGANACDTGFQ